jgi:Ulp1 family protease
MSLLLSYKDQDIYDRDLCLFEAGRWLNDACINFCLRRMEEEYGNTAHSILLLDPCIASFLFLQCEDEEEYEDLRINYELDRREWLLIPINNNLEFFGESTHWSLLAVRTIDGCMWHFDSCRQSNYEAAKLQSKKIRALIKQESSTEIVKATSAQQGNGCDCGVYVLLVARTLVNLIILGKTDEENDMSQLALAEGEYAYLKQFNDADAESFRRKMHDEIIGMTKSPSST